MDLNRILNPSIPNVQDKTSSTILLFKSSFDDHVYIHIHRQTNQYT